MALALQWWRRLAPPRVITAYIAAARRDSALRRRAWGVISMPALAITGV